MKRIAKILIVFLFFIVICHFVNKSIILTKNNAIGKQSNLQWYINNDTNFVLNKPNPNAWGKDKFKYKKIDINKIKVEKSSNNNKIVTIAIIDTYFFLGHNIFCRNIMHNQGEISNDLVDNDKNDYIDDCNGWDFVHNSNIINSVNEKKTEHATFIASLIVGKNDYYSSIIGENNNIKLLPLVVNDDDNIKIENIIQAIKYAENAGAKVCNMSLAIYSDYPELKRIIEKSKMLFVVAAGNDGKDLTYNDKCYPTCYNLDNVISVADMRCDGNLSKTSNYGRFVDIAAPGTDILGMIGNQKYTFKSGTSFSAAIVSACSALMYLYCDTDIEATKIKKTIIDTCVKSYELKNKVESNGYIDLQSAIKQISKY